MSFTSSTTVIWVSLWARVMLDCCIWCTNSFIFCVCCGNLQGGGSAASWIYNSKNAVEGKTKDPGIHSGCCQTAAFANFHASSPLIRWSWASFWQQQAPGYTVYSHLSATLPENILINLAFYSWNQLTGGCPISHSQAPVFFIYPKLPCSETEAQPIFLAIARLVGFRHLL